MDPNRVRQLGYIGIEVSDPATWGDFAAEVLGLELSAAGSDEWTFLRMDENHHRIALVEGRADDVAHVGWQVTGADELRAVAERLEAFGAEVSPGRESDLEARRVGGLVRVSDPNGVVNEIHHDPLVEPVRSFVSPRPISGFHTGELGFGHIVLNVDNYDESLRFYRDGLGLLISDFIELDIGRDEPLTIAFLHCGPRHHSVALVEYPSEKRLHHFMLELIDIDDVGTTHDLCQDRQIPIIAGMGRHTNDQMTSFYMESPSGFQIEYGHGGVEIDDDHWEIETHHAASIWGHRTPEPVVSG